ncbi:MAG: transcriptional repressor LexA [Armatimonadota bacterium]
MRKLTDRQEKVLQCIAKWLDEKGYPPSIREIASETGIRSTRGVTINLEALERAGYIQRDATARSIKLITDPHSMRGRTLPLIGTIAAGPPLLASEHVEAMITVPEQFSPGSDESFVLRVRGESMQGEGIFDGDMVVVRQQPVAENGELAAVIIDGEATVKRFYRDGPDQVRLEPSNPAYEPIIVSLKDSQTLIAGKVVGLLRSYR